MNYAAIVLTGLFIISVVIVSAEVRIIGGGTGGGSINRTYSISNEDFISYNPDFKRFNLSCSQACEVVATIATCGAYNYVHDYKYVYTEESLNLTSRVENCSCMLERCET